MTKTRCKKKLCPTTNYSQFIRAITAIVCFLLHTVVMAQNETISGTITDESGSPLPGANVLQRGTSNGVVTDFDGKYTITLSADGDRSLIFSYIGFVSKEIQVGTNLTIDVLLKEDSAVLDEVVVVGYGTQKKVNLTGAVDVVSSESIENRAIANVGEGLQGLVPNLNITVTSGDPTDRPDFNIRGFESINGGQPLILIDGVPMDLNRINPEDIETLTVLKDGSAAAIYGARGAFGVILVETKKGKQGKMNVQFSSQLSWNKPIFNVDPIDNGYIYALERNAAAVRDGGNPRYDDAYVEGLRLFWEDPENNPGFEIVDGEFRNYENPQLTRSLLNTTSPRQKYDLSISGANEKVNYFTSFGFFNTDGFYNHPGNDNFKRYNVLAKADFKINDWITFEQQFTGNFENSDKPGAIDINSLIRIEPIRPYVVPLIPGFERFAGENWNHAFPILAELEDGGRERFTNQDLWLKAGVVLTPFNNFKFTSNFSYNAFNRQFNNFRPQYQTIDLQIVQDDPTEFRGDNSIISSRDFNQYYVFNAFAEYEFTQLGNHYLKVLGGFNQEWGFNNNLRAEGDVLLSPDFNDIGATTGGQTADELKNQIAIRGVFYRFNYNYKERYLFEASTRYDGTSRFQKEDRYGLFPSFSLGWRISEEPFMEKTKGWLNNLKIRGSYGDLGNQQIRFPGTNRQDFYPYIPTLSDGTSRFVFDNDRNIFIGAPNLVSPIPLTWETVRSTNLGLDAALFDNRLEMNFDIYTRETLDMLLRRDFSDILGATPPFENGADLKTNGWEISVKWRDNIGKDWSYYINANLADWTSKITRFENPTGAIDTNKSDAGSLYYVGELIGQIWGFETVGVIQDEEQLANAADQSQIGTRDLDVGDIEYADLNGDGVVTEGRNTLDDPGDRKVIGNTTPRYSYGINTGVRYKGFGLDLFFQGVGKRDFMPGNGNWTWFYPWRSFNGDKSWITDSWRPDNRDAYFPEARIGGNNFRPQTRFLQDASYIRLKNINISYTFPSKWTDKVGISNFKIFAAGQNVWELTNIRKPLDPEYVFDDSIDYPLLRTYTIGLSFNL